MQLTGEKCDQLKPACSQCQRSGWSCPGPDIKTNLVFIHHTAKTNSSGNSLLVRYPRQSSLGLEGRVIELSTSVADRAASFFLHRYVLGSTLWSDKGFPQGVLQYLPCLLRHEMPTGLLSTIISAVGYAALSNARISAQWKHEAYRLYGKSIQQLQADLLDPLKVKSDATLAAILLMGTFEASCNNIHL